MKIIRDLSKKIYFKKENKIEEIEQEIEQEIKQEFNEIEELK